MAVKTTQYEKEVVYFITFTCYNWIPLFEITKLYDFIYKWFERLDMLGIKILGFVIMPNHAHLLIYFPDCKHNLNRYISEGKRFMAYEVIKRLKFRNELEILNLLKVSVSKTQRRSGQIHRVFEHSFDAKICYTRRFVDQKLNYIHSNPVSGKWNLVDDYAKFKHSSAGYYMLGVKPGFPVVDFREYV